jgi:hypothetical protein
VPYHVDATLECDPENLITFCGGGSHNCHFAIGHAWDWKAWRPECRRLAAAMLSAKPDKLQ